MRANKFIFFLSISLLNIISGGVYFLANDIILSFTAERSSTSTSFFYPLSEGFCFLNLKGLAPVMLRLPQRQPVLLVDSVLLVAPTSSCHSGRDTQSLSEEGTTEGGQ